MIVSDIKLYEILRLKLGEKEVETLVEFVDSKLKEREEENLKILATKEDLAKLESILTLRMFYFWMGQVAVIAGLLAYFFHINKT